MQIDTEFTVAAPQGKVWNYLQRTEEVVECIPGAEIDEKISDDEYKGHVTVKVGPLSLTLEGLAEITERNHDQMILAITGKAKDKRGRGATDATVTAQVHPAPDNSTRVAIVSDLRVSGKIAQFGRGVMKDVAQRIAEEFARNLEARIAADSDPSLATAAAGSGAKPAEAIGGIGLVVGALTRSVGRGVPGLFGRDKS
ncbi:SRPBCC family protein [Arthrobacter sp. NPDC057013]|uniref:SRPBCC family protein n=1 Tax=Arthrobacter sp. NPDC057013 TaxID=3345999 RepID=UPI003630E9ED